MSVPPPSRCGSPSGRMMAASGSLSSHESMIHVLTYTALPGYARRAPRARAPRFGGLGVSTGTVDAMLIYSIATCPRPSRRRRRRRRPRMSRPPIHDIRRPAAPRRRGARGAPPPPPPPSLLLPLPMSLLYRRGARGAPCRRMSAPTRRAARRGWRGRATRRPPPRRGGCAARVRARTARARACRPR